MKNNKSLFSIIFILCAFVLNAQNYEVSVKPNEYEHALRNPMKGFTTINVENHPWASLSHTYIRWNEIENNESDGIEKIINVSNQKWKNAAAKNMKVIPRVYLHWDGDKKYWPADMQEDDYTSEQFQARVLRLISRLGVCWDNDPRVAFVELGIIGKWGEHHSPSPSIEMQKLIGDAFAEAFKNKKVSVRQIWKQFMQHPFGEYWDSWAHYDQMWTNGNGIKKVNEETGRYKENYIGGEVAYNWGSWAIQPGRTPTHSVAIPKHREFVINSIRWLHCTQLRWISAYDKNNSEAIQGAEEMQKTFGYRYILDEVRFSMNDSLKIAFDVTNTGSAPFYYNWPIEVALLDSVSLQSVWKATMDSVDIRDWLPGEGWTDPDWKYVGSWQQYLPNENWNSTGITEWSVPPVKNTVEGNFKIDSLKGNFILSLSIIDPAGELPSIKFATDNYINGGRHPLGMVSVGENKCDILPFDFKFDEPNKDNTLYYDDEFEIVYKDDSLIYDAKRTPYKESAWQFPTDTVKAWQYDFINNQSGEKYFLLDSANTIGIYGCDDASGFNIRSYKDSIPHKDAAQFKWDQMSETFQKNGQWLEYSADFKLNQPYQLLLRARNNIDANFKLSILTAKGDTVFNKDFNLTTDFYNQAGGNEQTDWFLSKIPVTGLWGSYVVRFDWYDNLGEQGIFGGFSFAKSELDVTPPEWHFVSIGTFTPGTDIVVMTTEDAIVYLVPDGTSPDTASIKQAAVSLTEAIAYQQANLSTSGLNTGDYVVYAIDSSNNISEASRIIKLQYPVSTIEFPYDAKIIVSYNHANQIIKVKSSNEFSGIDVYNILGKKVAIEKCFEKEHNFKSDSMTPGIYLVRVYFRNGTYNTKKLIVSE